jgi:hypothetical protein
MLSESTLGMGRRMREAIVQRERLRRVLSQSLSGLSTADAYSRLKAPFAPHLTQEDLFPFCDAVRIQRNQLPLLLSPYGITGTRISPKHWTAFYENQVFFPSPTLPIPPSVTLHQRDILRRLAAAIRSHAARDLSSQGQLCSKRNPFGANPGRIRLSAICHVVGELDLAFDPAALIDAFLAFFGQPIECMDFAQFSIFMQAFD